MTGHLTPSCMARAGAGCISLRYTPSEAVSDTMNTADLQLSLLLHYCIVMVGGTGGGHLRCRGLLTPRGAWRRPPSSPRHPTAQAEGHRKKENQRLGDTQRGTRRGAQENMGARNCDRRRGAQEGSGTSNGAPLGHPHRPLGVGEWGLSATPSGETFFPPFGGTSCMDHGS